LAELSLATCWLVSIKYDGGNITSNQEPTTGQMNARVATGHSRLWKATLTLAIIVGVGRLALLGVSIGSNPSLSTVATVVTFFVVLAAAILIPMQVMRARSAEQVARTKQQNPGAVVVAAGRSRIGKHDYDTIDKSFRANLFYSVVATPAGIDIWQGGRNAKRELHIDADQIASVGTTDLQLGSGRYPAVRIVFAKKLNIPEGMVFNLPTDLTAEFFVRNPSRPQRPRPLDEVTAAAQAISAALSG
jgi:hypothetical protein